MIKLNGVELELDIMDLDTAEKAEQEFEKVVKLTEEIKMNVKDMKLSDCIKVQCYAVFECLDTIFGEGTHNKVFGDKVNLRECLEVFGQLRAGIDKIAENDKKEFKNITSKYSPNRAQRRNNKKRK